MNKKQKEILIIIAIILGAVWFGNMIREDERNDVIWNGESMCDYGACGD